MKQHLTARQQKKKIDLKINTLNKLYARTNKYGEHVTEILYNPKTKKIHVKITANGKFDFRTQEFTLRLDEKPKTLSQLFYIGKKD